MTLFYQRTVLLGAAALSLLKLGEIANDVSSIQISKTWIFRRTTSPTGNDLGIFTKYGSKRNAVFIMVHGMGNSSLTMARLGDVLVEDTCNTVIRYDRAGYGYSSIGTQEPFSISEAIRDLEHIISEVIEDHKQVVLIGYSLGGFIAHKYMEDRDSSDNFSAVLIEPTHPQEAVASPAHRLGLVMSLSAVEQRRSVSYLGGELLDRTIGPDRSRYPNDKYVTAIRRERRTWRCLKATNRELKTIINLLLDGELLNAPKAMHSVKVITSDDSAKEKNQSDLFRSFTASEESFLLIKDSNHDDILMKRKSINEISSFTVKGMVQA